MDLQFEKYIYEEILKIAVREHTNHEFGTILFHENQYELVVHKTYEEYMNFGNILMHNKILFYLAFSLDENEHFFLFSSPNIFATGVLRTGRATCHKIDYDKWGQPSGQKINWGKLKEEKDEILNLIKKKVS